MAKRKELTYRIFVNDELVDKLTEEQKAILSERLSKVMSEDYAQKIMKERAEQAGKAINN